MLTFDTLYEKEIGYNNYISLKVMLFEVVKKKSISDNIYTLHLLQIYYQKRNINLLKFMRTLQKILNKRLLHCTRCDLVIKT